MLLRHSLASPLPRDAQALLCPIGLGSESALGETGLMREECEQAERSRHHDAQACAIVGREHSGSEAACDPDHEAAMIGDARLGIHAHRRQLAEPHMLDHRRPTERDVDGADDSPYAERRDADGIPEHEDEQEGHHRQRWAHGREAALCEEATCRRVHCKRHCCEERSARADPDGTHLHGEAEHETEFEEADGQHDGGHSLDAGALIGDLALYPAGEGIAGLSHQQARQDQGDE